MKIEVTKKDVIWSYIGIIMSIGSNIIMLPFILYYLDGDSLGIWYVFQSIGGIAILFDFGFNPTFARNITYCWSGATELNKTDVTFVTKAEPNFTLMKLVIKTCKIIYFVISCLALIILLTLGTVYIKHISSDMPGNLHMIAWFIFCAAVFLNLYFGYYATFLRGVGAVAKINKITVVSRVIQIVLTVLLLISGVGLMSACIGYLLYGTVFRIAAKREFYKLENMEESLKRVVGKITNTQIWNTFVTVWHNAWKDGLVSLSNFLSLQASTIICSFYLSLTETGVYSLAVQLTTAIATVAAALYTVYQPTLQAAYINKNILKAKETMSLIVISYVVTFIIGMIGLIFIGIPVLSLLKPDKVIQIPALIGIAFYQFIIKWRNNYTTYISSTNHVSYMNSFVFSSILGIILSVIFIGMLDMGLWGLIIAQPLSQLIYNAWYWPMKVHRSLDLSFGYMIKINIIYLRYIKTLLGKNMERGNNL